MAALAAEALSEDPFSGVVLVFRSKRADRIKLVAWDGSRLVLVWKQAEGGALRGPRAWSPAHAPAPAPDRLSPPLATLPSSHLASYRPAHRPLGVKVTAAAPDCTHPAAPPLPL